MGGSRHHLLPFVATDTAPSTPKSYNIGPSEPNLIESARRKTNWNSSCSSHWIVAWRCSIQCSLELQMSSEFLSPLSQTG